MKSEGRPRLRILGVILGISLTSTACNTVAFYDKEHFSDPVMVLDPDATEPKLRQKVQYSREGAVGGIGDTAGGGCGCY